MAPYPGWKATVQMNRVFLKWLVCFVAVWLIAQVYAQSAAPTFPDPGKASMSRADQHALGLQAAAHVFEQMPVSDLETSWPGLQPKLALRDSHRV